MMSTCLVYLKTNAEFNIPPPLWMWIKFIQRKMQIPFFLHSFSAGAVCRPRPVLTKGQTSYSWLVNVIMVINWRSLSFSATDYNIIIILIPIQQQQLLHSSSYSCRTFQFPTKLPSWHIVRVDVIIQIRIDYKNISLPVMALDNRPLSLTATSLFCFSQSVRQSFPITSYSMFVCSTAESPPSDNGLT